MTLRKAIIKEIPIIWEILQQAIEHRKLDGSDQWQNGYPNEQTVLDDINNGCAYVLSENSVIIAYAAIIFEGEPSYNKIDGNWLTDDDYAVVHRVALSNAMRGKGIATILLKEIETLCLKKEVYSIKMDTNFDNYPMLRILEKLNYAYCGEIIFDGSTRKAYEKLITAS